MNRTKLLMLGLLVVLAGFVASSWAGLLQWWQSLPTRRRWWYALIALAFTALVIYRLI